MGSSPEASFFMPQEESHECAFESGVLVVIAGPTAAGKSKVQEGLIQRNPEMHRVITYTTRTPRKGEQDGVDYHFLNTATFEQELEAGSLIESDNYNDKYYGTPKSELNPLFVGRDITWIVTMPRALTLDDYLRNAYDETTAQRIIDQKLTLLVTTPSWEQLEEQFVRTRGGSHEEFTARINPDREFLRANQDRFAHIIYNPVGGLEQTIDQAQQLLIQKREQLKARS